ncbi:hypothetical protein HD806DRAFT_383464 [Xylariaceae sp. AK1471]|nr:hypothetical protein HD806DRAFT_383464 [Xylariaceae sp. AK1471]
MSSRAPPPPTSTPYRPPRPIRRGATPSSIPNATALKSSGGGSSSSWATPKRMIWTGAFAAVTIVGTIYGAGLKTQQEYQAEKKKILETPPEERIAALEARRAALVTSKRPLEQKLQELQLRVQKQEQNDADGRS